MDSNNTINTNTSCYIRIPFTFNGDVNDFNYMKLKVRYDDGFIVYLNGDKVELRPANAAMKPILVDASAVKIQGIVIGLIRSY